jgi:biopolymer transport protein ExbD
VAYTQWFATRTFVPLDIPITLSRGHIKTNDFYINLKERCLVEVNVDYPFTYKPDCPIYGPESVIKTHLTLSRDGQVLESIEGLHYFFIADFEAREKGGYRLDIDVLSDASCLNAGRPRLVVRTWPGFYADLYEAVGWFSLVPILGGLGLLGSIMLAGVWEKLTRSQRPAISERSVSSQGSWSRKHRPAKTFCRLPSFGLVAATALSFVLVVFMADHANRPVSIGIWVPVQQHPPATNGSVPMPPLIVRLESAGSGLPPRLYLDSRLVPKEDFAAALREQLKGRPDWVVCVDADPNVPWAEAMSVIDTIRGLHAKAELLTSGTTKTAP